MSEKDLASTFREAFRCHPAGVAVITANSDGKPVAMTISSLISVGSAPPLVGFSLSARSGSTPAVLAAETVVIHLLRYDNLELAKRGATPGADRFGEDIAWERLPTGEPRYTDVTVWFRAKLHHTLAVEGAHVVVAQLLDGCVGQASHAPELQSLVYLDRRWHRLRETLDGHAEASARTRTS